MLSATCLIFVLGTMLQTTDATQLRATVTDNDLYDNEVNEYADVLATQDDNKQSKS